MGDPGIRELNMKYMRPGPMKFPVYQDKPIQRIRIMGDGEKGILWESVAEKPFWSRDQR